jgi:hypothetical protein
VTGCVAPYALTVWVMAFLVLLGAVLATAGVVQQFSRHGLSKALPMALFGIVFGMAAVSTVRLSVAWAASDIRRLLETAATSERIGQLNKARVSR